MLRPVICLPNPAGLRFADMQTNPGGAAHVRGSGAYFIGVSGLGWLLDISLLVLLVGRLGLQPFPASIASACTAALGVFLISRRFIFRGRRNALGARIALYMGYSICMILAAAAAIHGLVHWGRAAAIGLHWSAPAPLLAACAKVVVTPPQLLANFHVARFMSEHNLNRQVAKATAVPHP
jgi:putative flippase GtrA